jgi:ribosomal protein L34E
MITSSLILIAVLGAFSPNGQDTAHNGPLKISCVDCHTRLPLANNTPSLRAEVKDVCASCHKAYHGADAVRSHPLNVVPSLSVPSDMLLDDQGRIVCITCHAFHGEYRDEEGGKLYYLRRSPGKTLCYSCHKKLPGVSVKS